MYEFGCGHCGWASSAALSLAAESPAQLRGASRVAPHPRTPLTHWTRPNACYRARLADGQDNGRDRRGGRRGGSAA